MSARLKIDPDTGKVKEIMLWCPINGDWVHIVQQFEDDSIQYFVNGVALTELPPLNEKMIELTNKEAGAVEEVSNENGS